jgi:hypothetical protein
MNTNEQNKKEEKRTEREEEKKVSEMDSFFSVFMGKNNSVSTQCQSQIFINIHIIKSHFSAIFGPFPQKIGTDRHIKCHFCDIFQVQKCVFLTKSPLKMTALPFPSHCHPPLPLPSTATATVAQHPATPGHCHPATATQCEI